MDKLLVMVLLTMIASFFLGILLSSISIQTVGVSIVQYIIFIVGCLAILGYVIFRNKREKIIKIVANYYGFVIIFLAAAMLLSPIFSYLKFSGLTLVTIFTSSCGIIVLLYDLFWEKYLNTFVIFTCAVVGAWLGYSTSLEFVILLFIGFAVYDLYAVFRSNLMKGIILKVIAAKTIPPLFFTDMNLKEVRNRLENKKSSKKSIKGHLLGGGDAILGSMFPIAVAIHYNILFGFVVLVGGFIGILLNFYIVDKRRVGLPALPLILSSELALLAIVLIPLWGWFLAALALGVAYFGIDWLAQRQAVKLGALQKAALASGGRVD